MIVKDRFEVICTIYMDSSTMGFSVHDRMSGAYIDLRGDNQEEEADRLMNLLNSLPNEYLIEYFGDAHDFDWNNEYIIIMEE